MTVSNGVFDNWTAKASGKAMSIPKPSPKAGGMSARLRIARRSKTQFSSMTRVQRSIEHLREVFYGIRELVALRFVILDSHADERIVKSEVGP